MSRSIVLVLCEISARLSCSESVRRQWDVGQVGTFANDFLEGGHARHCRRHPQCCGTAVDATNATQAAAAAAAAVTPNPSCHADPVCWRVFRRAFTVRMSSPIPRLFRIYIVVGGGIACRARDCIHGGK